VKITINRKTIYFIKILTLLLFLESSVYAQENQMDIIITNITESIHKLYVSDYVYMYTFSGPDGTLLIDSGYQVDEEALKHKLKDLGASDVKYIINTHSNTDHIGGNHLFENAVIIAHPNCRRNLMQKEQFSVEGLPNLTLNTEITIHFNSEEIKIFAMPGGHTDGDLVIYFVNSRLVFLGDIIVPDTFPVIWYEYFENVGTQKLVSNIRKLLDFFLNDIKFISSHGRDYTKEDLNNYYSMINETIAIVREKIEQGKSLVEIQEENALERYRSYDSKRFDFINADFWIETIFNDITK
jgi:glyoxylase-like metal-dependent hydrolase (beta-lactamase superfamily II)